ncbi:NUDIX hydrolase [Undibacter mobilis]|uniref:NUDIX hydrolase n=1 Tax=Undibacter mobilis TaxID=2292256 RepID=A0A371BBV4_9BRAD|nr:NUDIX hydrolase [Undibacter mobilis]RDV05048.1 NUDIX hydrolase [Undibacter mobilis]
MTSPGSEQVLHVDRLELTFEPRPWAFADAHRRDIDALFADMQKKKPALFNGRVLLMHRCAIEDGVFGGGFMEADYASFTFWIASGRPAAGIHDCFGAAAVMSADGAFLLGEMGAHTFNAGQIYFPCGTPDLSDLVGSRVDFDLSVRRELKEETGLEAAELTEEPGWTLAIDGSLICAIKVMRSPLDAEALRVRMLKHLAHERQPELADIRIVRGSDDFSLQMRSFARIFLSHRFAA